MTWTTVVTPSASATGASHPPITLTLAGPKPTGDGISGEASSLEEELTAEFVSDTYGTYFGGAPEKTQDFVPSIIFLVAYSLLVPVAIYRVCRKDSRCDILWRPCFFIGFRIIVMVCRIILANQYEKQLHEDHTTYSGQEALLSLGFIFLSQGVVELVLKYKWATLVHHYSNVDHWRRFLGIYSNLLHLLALVCGTIASSFSGTGRDVTKDAQTAVMASRIFGILLPLAMVMGLSGLSAWWLYRNPRSPYGIKHQRMTSVIVLLCSAMLMLVGSDRLFLIARAPQSVVQLLYSFFNPLQKRHFYVLEVGPEFIATSCLVCFNWKRLLRPELELPKPEHMRRFLYDDDGEIVPMNKKEWMELEGEPTIELNKVERAWARLKKRRDPIGWITRKCTLTFHYY